jgi:RloB-like protein
MPMMSPDGTTLVTADRPFKRRLPTREIRQRFLIVCEGETEVAYFDALKNRRHLTSVKVTALTARTSDPAEVVREAKRRDKPVDRWDQVWCVYDIEAPPNPSSVSSIATAAKAGHRVAWSNPCFEVWLLFHYHSKVSPFGTSAAATTALGRYIPDFKKSGPVTDKILDMAETAVKRAAATNVRHDKIGTQAADANPNTLVGVLVDALLKYAT